MFLIARHILFLLLLLLTFASNTPEQTNITKETISAEGEMSDDRTELIQIKVLGGVIKFM